MICCYRPLRGVEYKVNVSHIFVGRKFLLQKELKTSENNGEKQAEEEDYLQRTENYFPSFGNCFAGYYWFIEVVLRILFRIFVG